ncbi:MAG: addiction module protein [Sandaracinaceae bacterium]|nr:addiction module protein [Sandaracinaceae bacterium]
MTSTAQKILEDALSLPEDERAALADALNESLSPKGDLSPAWKAEIARRIEAVEGGESRLIPGDEALARVRAALESR